jgi:hypothetical protein
MLCRVSASAVPGRNGSTKSNSTATACIRPSIAARCGYSPAPDSTGRINIRRSPRRCRHLGAAMSRRHRTNSGEEVRFAQASPLEGAGFELSVPREGKLRSRDCRVDRDGIFSRKGAGSVRSAVRFEPFPPPPRSVLGTHSRAVGCRITRPCVVVSCSRTIRL